MRDRLIRAKFWFYRYSGALTVVAVCAAGAISAKVATLSGAAAVLASVVTLAFGMQKQKLSELELFRTLFKDFNARYEVLDDKLREIGRHGEQQLSPDEVDVLISYFNLCAEEFLYYTQGYIHPQAWTSWRRGMEEFLSNPLVADLWNKEAAKQSYYGLEGMIPSTLALLDLSSPSEQSLPLGSKERGLGLRPSQ